MYLADYHVHSRISPDSAAPMADMARAALAAGLDELCFTDHVQPVALGTGARPAFYDWAALLAEFDLARAELGDRISLRLGIELGDAGIDVPHTEKLLSNMPPMDFIIGSVHMLPESWGCTNLYLFDPKDEEEAYKGIAAYLEEVRTLAQWGNFSVLGHLTLPLRYLNENRGFQLTFDRFEDEVREILQILVDRGRGIELNTNRGNAPLPGEKWLRLYRSLGGEILTLGSDAHHPEMVGCRIRESLELLKACGFTRFCTFRKMEPVWHKL
ncbi:MAG: histidinol-phosphatase HisJ family protein [Oscillibacter sp.]|nr:histidinol-phosphatase HisJ family protein [Oscillibacter sp.]